MKDLLENLAIILVALLFGPIVVICALIGKIPISLFNKKTQDIPLAGKGIRISISVVGIAAWLLAIYFIRPSACEYYSSAPFCPTPEVTPTIAVVFIPVEASNSTQAPDSLPSPVVTSTQVPPHACPFQGMTANETIVSLIQAEAQASNAEDLSIIQAIFDPDAIYFDFASEPTKSWNGALNRYKELFSTTNFKDAEHIDILPVGDGISGDSAYYTSGSKGSFQIEGNEWVRFFNGSLISDPATDYGSDHWILKKDRFGCWVIVQMEFNAGHIKFPR